LGTGPFGRAVETPFQLPTWRTTPRRLPGCVCRPRTAEVDGPRGG